MTSDDDDALDEHAQILRAMYAEMAAELPLRIALKRADEAFDEGVARLTLRRLCERRDGTAEIHI